MQLYDYQQTIINELGETEKEHNNVVICAGTGSGKSVMLASICLTAMENDQKVLVLVHRNILVEQLAKTLQNFGVDIGYIKSGYPFNAFKNVYIASVQTLSRRKVDIQFDRVAIDEAHICTHSKVTLDLMERLNAKFTGFTATPFPTSKKRNIAKYYTREVIAPTPWELMQMGKLSPEEYYSPPSYNASDTDNLKITSWGEYDSTELAKLCRQPILISYVVSEWFRLTEGVPTIVFSSNVEHSKDLEKAFAEQGVPTAHIDGTFSEKRRHKIYSDFRAGKVRVIVNCQILTEGADFPFVECVVLACPILSKARYIQAVGRGLRTSDETGKQFCTIIDHGNNVQRHGFIRHYTRDDYRLQPYEKPSKLKMEPMTKPCGNCHYEVHLSVKECPKCGHVFPVKEEEDVPVDLTKMVKLDPDQALEYDPRRDYPEALKHFEKTARMCFYGNKSPFAIYAICKKKFDIMIKDDDKLNRVLGKSPSPHKIKKYAHWVLTYAAKKGDNDYVLQTFRNFCTAEFGIKAVKMEPVKGILNTAYKSFLKTSSN